MRLLLIMILSLLPLTKALAQGEPVTTLDAELRLFDLQLELVSTGNLNAEAGRAKQADLRGAIASYRRAIKSDATGPLTVDEREMLAEHHAQFMRYMDFRPIEDKDTKVRLFLPHGLFPLEPKKDQFDRTWTKYAGFEDGLNLHVFRYPLYAETPLSLMTRLLERRRNINYEFFGASGTGFTIEGTADWLLPDGKHKPYFFHIRAWEQGGQIIGFMAWFNITPPEGFRVIDLPVPDDEKTVLDRPSGKVAISAEEGNWRRLILAIVNHVASQFETLNGWSQVSTEGCRKRLVSGRRGPSPERDDRPRFVRIFLATDRKPVAERLTLPDGSLHPDYLFGADPDNALHIACAVISVPPNATSSVMLDKPKVTQGRAQGFDPQVHYTVEHIKDIWPNKWEDPGSNLYLVDEEQKGSFNRALLYLHGYNTSFSDALLRVAQIASGLEHGRRIYMFSWPSQRKVLSYGEDMDNAERAEPALQKFVQLILRDTNISNLDIIAHSMGSQMLLRSIEGLRPIFDRRFAEPNETENDEKDVPTKNRVRLGQVIFAAPDVSTLVFQDRLRKLTPFARRVTVYTSRVDKALRISEWIRGKIPRAGSIVKALDEPVMIESPNVHVVDVTGELPSRLSLERYLQWNHNYFADNPAVLADIQSLLRDSSRKNPKRRAETSKFALPHEFEPVEYKIKNGSVYWRMKLKNAPLPTRVRAATEPAAISVRPPGG